jgi:galactose-1-phosphate uridylyltransferase
MSEQRLDPITHDWVIINPNRATRPKDEGAAQTACPFCPGNEHLIPEPTQRVVPNKFPAPARQPHGAET